MVKSVCDDSILTSERSDSAAYKCVQVDADLLSSGLLLQIKRDHLRNMTSRFAQVEAAPAIEVFALNKGYTEDTFKNKVSLGVGAYRNEEGTPWVLPVVRLAEKNLAADDTINKEYFPILGLENFSFNATKLLLGAQNDAFIEQRAFGVQSLSGTGALRIGAEFLHRVLGYNVYYYSNPSWENHKLIFNNSGFTESREYRYWCPESRGLNMEGLLEDLRGAPENAVIILHVCAHNPTGCDPTEEQWKEIADVMEERKLFPFFDSAYQGFASGDLEKDSWVVRYFVSRGFELFCAQSFSKNFGLYNERIGNLTIVLNNASNAPLIKSQMSIIVRGMYSNPPSHGARIVSFVLNNNDLFNEWKDNVRTMSTRIFEMRKALRGALERLQTPGNWDHITTQIGMFSYTGLTAKQSQHMVEKHHIYMLRSGRISMCGLTHKNIEYVASAIHETVCNITNKL
ncbi:PREDICTED: aspartate aminotransferase, cytoplasmic [Nicrophorus vespilloides]|uniref:Aspartate aminotransferase n=1 Tax=Nicrophorus vespilloides TaxID=110193 RepID=A0ABM1MT30_NICVS|nr:PREDICTED: aspartate aminotransferase, cytoplasmic [Nicrophorus vespilloides]